MLRSPVGPCIRVKWCQSIEFVPIHPKHECPSVFETVEYLSDSKTWVRYHPTFKENAENGKTFYKMKYSAEKHPKLKGFEGVCWGTSTIVIDKKSQSVRAHWKDADNPNESGFRPAKIVELPERIRANARPTVRNQLQLRNILLDTDRSCAITGEETRATLECTHILPVENGGFEIDSNAILLRAGLHCLYDNGSFEISSNGKIVNVSNKLSTYYKSLLEDKRLESDILRRIASSLAKRRFARSAPA